MTRRESELLAAIRRLTVEGVPPTLRQLADAMRLASTCGIARLLKSLKEQGKVTWDPYRARSIVIIEDAIAPVVLRALSDAALDRALNYLVGVRAERQGALKTADALQTLQDAVLHRQRRAA